MAITPLTDSPTVEEMLTPYRDTIGGDYEGYRGHIYRVLSYALGLLGPDHPKRRDVEAALVFHDIGMWTDGELAYLDPSIAEARRADAAHGYGLDLALVEAAIQWHHKITPYKGPGAEVVNAVRRADWVDATQGKFRMGFSKSDVAAVEGAIANAGFHDTLQRLAGDLNGGNKIGGLMRVLRRVYKL